MNDSFSRLHFLHLLQRNRINSILKKVDSLNIPSCIPNFSFSGVHTRKARIADRACAQLEVAIAFKIISFMVDI